MLDHRAITTPTTSSGPSGLDYLDKVKSLFGEAREKVTLDFVRERNLPDSMLAFAEWPRVRLYGKDGQGNAHELVVQVSPDFFRVGDDEATAVMAPMTPVTAQRVADELKIRTIGKPLARAVYQQAKVIGSLYLANPGEPYYDTKTGTPRNIEDSRAWAAADQKRNKWLAQQLPDLRARKSTLVAGHAKDVVQQASALAGGGKKVSGNMLAIYGGGGGKVDGWAIQPFPGPHTWDYGPDYSHGIRFARNRALLDGKPVRLDDVAKDPVLGFLLSDAGPFDNRMSMPKGGGGMSLVDGEGKDLFGPYVPTGLRGDDDDVPSVYEEAPQAAEKSGGAGGMILALGLLGGLAVWKAKK